MEKNITCIDLETTEVDKTKARILQLAAVVFDPSTGRRIKEKSWYIKPTGKWSISLSAADINGITPELIEKEGVPLASIVDEFKELIEDTDILTHNGTVFDLVILEREFERIKVDIELDSHNFIDTCDIERRTHSNRLMDTYRRYYGKEFENAHDAFADVQATIDVFLAQQKQVNPEIITESNTVNSEMLKISPEGFIKRDEDGNLVFNVGKYRGKSTNDICRTDPSYIKWVFGTNSMTGERNTTILTQRAIQGEWLKYKRSLNTKK